MTHLRFDAYTCRCGTINLFHSDWCVWAKKPKWRCLRCDRPLPGTFHSCSNDGERCRLCGVRVYDSGAETRLLEPVQLGLGYGRLEENPQVQGVDRQETQAPY